MLLQTKIEKACAVDSTRKALESPYFDGKKIYATNGHILAVVPVDVEGEAPGYIPVEAIKESRKQKTSHKGMVYCNGSAKVIGSGAEYPRNPGEHTFPNAAMAEGFALQDVAKKSVTIAFSAKLLLDLAQAIGADEFNNGVTLEIPVDEKGQPKESGIKVTGNRRSVGYGVLMPLRSKG